MIKAYAKTDVGKVRQSNQDSFYISNPLDDVQVFLVADGMGGYNGGEVASALAIKSALSYIVSNFKTCLKDREHILGLVKSSMEYANMIVYEKQLEDKELSGMGTTLEVCLVHNNKVYIGHIGDSRVYRVRKELTRKLTTDHSYVQKLLKDGEITQEQALHHPKKNYLLKAIGVSSYIEPDVMVKGFLKEDILLIGTDGLTNMVTNDEIYKYCKADIQYAPKELINIANAKRGYDNATCVVIKNI